MPERLRQLALVLTLALTLASIYACRGADRAPAPPTPDTRETPTMGKLAPEQVQRTPPDGQEAAPWMDAFDVYVAVANLSPSILAKPGIICRLDALEDPDGEVVPFLMTARIANARSVQLVHDGDYIPPGAGKEAAERYFAAIDFPAQRKLSRQLLGELLRHFGLLSSPFYPFAHTWELIDAHYSEQEMPLPVLSYDERGATFSVEAYMSPGDNGAGGGVDAVVRTRKSVHIAPDGTITVTSNPVR